MNDFYCEKEPELVAAIHTGQPHPEILAHARACPACSEVVLAASFLRAEKQQAAQELVLPDPGLIWQKSRTLAHKEAMARAIRPIRWAWTCAGVVAVLASPWLVFQLLQVTGPQNQWVRSFLAFDGTMFAAFTPIILLSMTGTLIFIALSSWYMLREESATRK